MSSSSSAHLSDRDIERINSVRRDHAELNGTPYEPIPSRAAKRVTTPTSKPVFQDIFALSGRRNRKSAFLFGLANASALVAIWAVVIGLMDSGGPASAPALLAGIILTIPIIIAGVAVNAQRCRDFGWTGWTALIGIIPYIGIIALVIPFIPGNVGPNRYGPDPLGSARD